MPLQALNTRTCPERFELCSLYTARRCPSASLFRFRGPWQSTQHSHTPATPCAGPMMMALHFQPLPPPPGSADRWFCYGYSSCNSLSARKLRKLLGSSTLIVPTYSYDGSPFGNKVQNILLLKGIRHRRVDVSPAFTFSFSYVEMAQMQYICRLEMHLRGQHSQNSLESRTVAFPFLRLGKTYTAIRASLLPP